MSDTSKRELEPISVVVGILVLGSIWGFLEATFGGFIKQIGFPLRSATMTGLGIGILAIAAGIYHRAYMLPLIAMIAVLSKLLVVPILQLTLFCRANSQLALGLGGITLAGVYHVFRNRLDNGRYLQVAIGAITGFVTAILFVNLGMHLAPCQPLLAFNYPGGAVDFMWPKGLQWTMSSAICFPLGYILGERIRDRILNFERQEPVFYYATSSGIILFCWMMSVIAAAAGL